MAADDVTTDPTVDVAAFETDGGRLVWRGDGETLVVEPWGTDAVRVRAVMTGDVLDTDWALLPPADVTATTEVEAPQPLPQGSTTTARLRVGRLTVVAEATSTLYESVGHTVHRCRLRFLDARGDVLLEEVPTGGSLQMRARDWRAHPGGDHALTAAFHARPDEKLYGMGQYQQHVLDLKGCTLELAHRNSQASVPFVLSSAGYGLLWHNPAVGRATFARNRTEWEAGHTRQLDYWLTVGDTPAEITAAYSDATGHAPPMPERGLGFWQCKLRYTDQEQLLEVVREHRRRGLPLDVVVADFFHWPRMGDFRFEEEFWPDPTAMVAELREHGVELMVSVWPQVALDSENSDRFAKENLLVRTDRGMAPHMAFEGPSRFLDMTNPRARAELWRLCRENYLAHGIRTFWLDEAEPEYGVYDFDNYRYHLGPVAQVGNVYPQLYAAAFDEGLRAAGETDVVNLVRCAWAGSQRHGALVWSGDISSTWTDLRRQLTAGIHMGVAGIPWFTTDIGGFHAGDSTDPAFHELLVRWFQFGAFCPVMRLHGDRLPHADVRAADGSRRLRTGAPNELWSYGEEVYDLLAPYVHLREAMRPYLREVMSLAHTEGQPVMRGLFHDFPDDSVCWDVDDQFLLGSDILVAPVLERGVTSRLVYLPEGAEWLDPRTGRSWSGGQEVELAAPLASVPVLARTTAHPELLEALRRRLPSHE
ncbi:glycoside hydrolase family 31 protein [Aquipuribacter sp. SD81]|uniref:glycoside hydrolase family 31 protein n=1 Tax=Aquipuribacter sp. SD81 TaxID=3127703 RepID=UPI0030198FF2